MVDDGVKPGAQEIEDELHRILSSKVFAMAQRSQDFLRYVVERSLTDAPGPFKEFAIAMDVFSRSHDYDPAIDATVRVEAGRLRSRLREYYDGEGKDDPVFIDIPKGGYSPAFTLREGKLGAGKVVPLIVEQAGSVAGTSVRRTSLSWGHWAAVGLVLLTLLAAGGWRWHWRSQQRDSNSGASQQIALAVLPFANETGDKANDYLADGLTDNLIRQLSEIPPLRVMARGAVYRFRSSADKAVSIGRSLHVNSVLTGEIHQVNGKLTVDTELSNMKDGSIIESHRYLPESDDLRPVQASITQDVIHGLKIELDARQSAHVLRPVSSSVEAYQEMLRGETAARGNSPMELHDAIGHFERAVKLDPKFTIAWADLAQAHLLLGIYFEDPRQHMPQASEYATRAQQLDPEYGEAHGTLGLVELLYDWDYAAASAELASAKDEQSALTVLSCTSHLMAQTGRTRDADEMVHRMLGYDPQSAQLIGELGCIDYYRGDYENAMAHYRDAMAKDPHSPVPYWGLGKTLSLQGKYGQAVKEMRQFKPANGFEPPLLTAEIGYALGREGKISEAQREIAELREQSKSTFVDPYLVSLIYLGMGDERGTLQSLNRAYVVRSPFLISISTEPKWKEMIERPGLQAFLARMTPLDHTRG
ncbi:MAG TPA: tetratricopeptide repeat protein [Edaphobacter sp.]|nr:tetratricopeptide repeat protein [Edaphobacter sp.]